MKLISLICLLIVIAGNVDGSFRPEREPVSRLHVPGMLELESYRVCVLCCIFCCCDRSTGMLRITSCKSPQKVNMHKTPSFKIEDRESE